MVELAEEVEVLGRAFSVTPGTVRIPISTSPLPAPFPHSPPFLSLPSPSSSPSFPRFRLAISTTVSGGDFSARPILSLPRIQSQRTPPSLPHLRSALALISASVHSDLRAAPTVTIKEVSRRKPEMHLCGNRETIPGLG